MGFSKLAKCVPQMCQGGRPQYPSNETTHPIGEPIAHDATVQETAPTGDATDARPHLVASRNVSKKMSDSGRRGWRLPAPEIESAVASVAIAKQACEPAAVLTG